MSYLMTYLILFLYTSYLSGAGFIGYKSFLEYKKFKSIKDSIPVLDRSKIGLDDGVGTAAAYTTGEIVYSSKLQNSLALPWILKHEESHIIYKDIVDPDIASKLSGLAYTTVSIILLLNSIILPASLQMVCIGGLILSDLLVYKRLLKVVYKHKAHKREYRADAYATNNTSKDQSIAGLMFLQELSHEASLTHPSSYDRVRRIINHL